MLGDLDRSGLGCLLHPRRQVDRVPQRRVLHPEVGADLSNDHQSRVDADPDTDRDAPGLLGPGRIGAYGIEHLQSGHDGTLRIVLMGDRRSEEAEHGISLESGQGPLVAVNRLDHPLEGAVYDLCPVLWVELLGCTGGSLDVGKEHGDRTPLSGHGLALPGCLDLGQELVR